MRKPLVLVLLSFAVAGSSLAQAPSLGSEFRVNTNTAGNQSASNVAMNASGAFVVVWQTASPDDQDSGIFAQRFDATGAPIGAEFRVNTYTTGEQQRAAVSMTASGAFVVVWQSPQEDGPGLDIRSQRFDQNGEAVGTEFRVNTETGSRHQNADVAVRDDGAFVVAWQTADSDDYDGAHIRARRFDAAGEPLGDSFEVAPAGEASYGTILPTIASSGSGEFVVAWHDRYYYSLYTLRARRYDASGVALCEQNLGSTRYPPAADIASSPGGDMVAVWSSFSQQHYDVRGTRLTSSCETRDFLVSHSTSSDLMEPRVAVDAGANFIVSWQRGFAAHIDVDARRFSALGAPVGSAFLVNEFTRGEQAHPSVAVNAAGIAAVSWDSMGQDGSGLGVFARRIGAAAGAAIAVDEHPAGGGSSNVNGVLEVGETVRIEPSWQNGLAVAFDLTGTAELGGPAGPIYGVPDAQADYGSIPSLGLGSCVEDCFEVSIAGPRPVDHWDALLQETVSTGDTKTWILHVGESFGDVPAAHPFYSKIETLFHSGISGGCGEGSFCPGDPVRRDQMAAFLLKAVHGSDYTPPRCRGIFADVACPGPFADWIERLSTEGVTGGCGEALYCPDRSVTRAQMAVFLLKASHGSGYTPPACAGIFDDVPCPGPFTEWIEELFLEGISAGCGAGDYCPDASSSRGQMAAFLVRTFGLRLYGP